VTLFFRDFSLIFAQGKSLSTFFCPQSLKRKERDYEHEMERLAREKIACQQRLSALKKELSAQWDHIDFAALLPEAPPTPVSAPANSACAVAASTSATSSAPPSSRGGRSFDSDEDFEFEEMEEDEMRRNSHRSDISPQHSASTSTASGKETRMPRNNLLFTQSRLASLQSAVNRAMWRI
jgi:hypothetical protein